MLSVVLTAWALASPVAWHSLNPQPNPHGWHNTPVSVTLEASGGANLQVCYRLNGGNPVCQPPPVVLHLSEEGVHTLEYWARDDTGESPHKKVAVRIDLTPPFVRIMSPAEDARYLLHQPVRAEWWAHDRLSGLEFVEATAQSGEPVDTGTAGRQTFRVLAWDRAGNTTHLEVEYLVICVIETVLPTGFFLDRLLPPEEAVRVGKFVVRARYRVGEPVILAFRLKDFFGKEGAWTRPSLLVSQVRPDPEFEEKHTIWAWLPIPYDAKAGYYSLAYDTSEREPGIYDLWLSFGDGQTERIRIQILPKEGKEGQ